MERVPTGPLWQDGDEACRGHFNVNGLPEVAIRAVNVDLCRSKPERIAPQAKLIPFLERQSYPALEGRFGEFLLKVDDEGDTFEAHAHSLDRLGGLQG